MVKTRSQTGNITIKKEEEEDYKPTLLNGHTKTSSANKIAKKNKSKNNNIILPVQHVKVEQDTDIKSLLQSSLKAPKRSKAQNISQEQINQLIDYIVNHNMSITEASRKVNIAHDTGYRYYKLYRNDPKKKVPVPQNKNTRRTYTQEHIENLIGYIINDKLNIKEASAKADISYRTAAAYYKRYLDDPDHNIPVRYSGWYYTQDQKNKLISYIVNDKMNIKAAARKVNMGADTGRKYYYKYLKNQCPDIPVPSHIVTRKHCTQEQKQELINYIVNDKMSVKAAARKANMSDCSGWRYYYKYFKEQHPDISTPNHIATPKYTQEQKNKFISYIVNDKMNITAASKKANMSVTSGREYYHKHFNNEHPDIPAPSHIVTFKRYTQEQIKEVISYIVDDKMSIAAASSKMNMDRLAATRYYRQYLKDNDMKIPVPRKTKQYTQDEINQLIRYIVDDKMTVRAASKKANVGYDTARIYYNKYLKKSKAQCN